MWQSGVFKSFEEMGWFYLRKCPFIAPENLVVSEILTKFAFRNQNHIIMKKQVLLIVLMLMPLMARADYYGVKINGIYYDLNSTDKVAEVTSDPSGTTKYFGSITIPNTVTYGGVTYSVTRIGTAAFSKSYSLTSVTIPNGVTSIRNSAFSGCSGLTSITIPSSVTVIGVEAFYGCSVLKSVNISDIAAWCNISFFDNPLYYSHHLFLNGEEVKDLNIPESVTSIMDKAFYRCSGLTSVTIGNSVTSIGDAAFSGCSGLTSVTIGNNVTSIGEYAFNDCSGLKSVNISDIAAWCNISFPVNIYTSNPLYYAHHLFLNGKEVKDLVIPNSVTSIESSTFCGCSYLTSLTIPKSVSSIGDKSVYNCLRLNTIYCLNPIPPTCGLETFICSYSNIRDKYDVYTYATLHVPMGSEEIYSSAHDWRYFNKIKEDMEANGTVYYANLTVKQGTIGYTRQAIKAAETYTIFIGSLGDNKVNCVTFNGEDVTDKVVNGYYTTPEIKGESVLSISFETGMSVKSLTLNSVKVKGYNGEISVDNIDEPSDVIVYSAEGKIVGNIPSAFGSVNLQVPSEQLYIVKVGSRTYKVAL